MKWRRREGEKAGSGKWELDMRRQNEEFEWNMKKRTTRLLFNIPLWFGGLSKGDGVAVASLLVSTLTNTLAERSGDCDFVSVSDVVSFLQDLITMEVSWRLRYFVSGQR